MQYHANGKKCEINLANNCELKYRSKMKKMGEAGLEKGQGSVPSY